MQARSRGRVFRDREGRPFRRAYLRKTARTPRRSTSRRRTRTLSSHRRRNLPMRDANGRFIKRRVSAPRRRRARPQPVRRVRRNLPTTSVVREASRRSVAGPALVRRRWWRIDGPVDPSLPNGYAYQR